MCERSLSRIDKAVYGSSYSCHRTGLARGASGKAGGEWCVRRTKTQRLLTLRRQSQILCSVCRMSPSKSEEPVSSHGESVVVLLLTLSDAARRLGVCRRTLERLIAGGKFPPPVKIRGARRVPCSDVERYVRELVSARAS